MTRTPVPHTLSLTRARVQGVHSRYRSARVGGHPPGGTSVVVPHCVGSVCVLPCDGCRGVRGRGFAHLQVRQQAFQTGFDPHRTGFLDAAQFCNALTYGQP